MGLDTSHGCWHGAYSAFTRWRQKLAEVAGFAVWPVIYGDTQATMGQGYGRPTVMIDWGHLPEGALMGEWGDRVEADPLVYLIAHHDCEGVIHPAQGAPLADRLESLLPLLPGEADLGHIGDWRETTEAFIKGLRDAASRGEDVVFS